MTEYEILYRGVPVPKSVILPGAFLGGEKILEAFKAGVDATHDLRDTLDVEVPNPVEDKPVPDPDKVRYFEYARQSSDRTYWKMPNNGDYGHVWNEHDETWSDSACDLTDLERAVGQTGTRYREIDFLDLPPKARGMIKAEVFGHSGSAKTVDSLYVWLLLEDGRACFRYGKDKFSLSSHNADELREILSGEGYGLDHLGTTYVPAGLTIEDHY